MPEPEACASVAREPASESLSDSNGQGTTTVTVTGKITGKVTYDSQVVTVSAISDGSATLSVIPGVHDQHFAVMRTCRIARYEPECGPCGAEDRACPIT